jgi:ferredoxin--NADP+ reductase
VTHRVAVVGAGPSGFYVSQHLLAAGVEVDLYESLPTPFGLVRAGVAPDHPKIKKVTRVFEKTAAHPGLRFFGHVELGSDVHCDELLGRYDAVIYAVGTADDRRLGIPGEGLAGVYPASAFVAWYNGHPAHANDAFDLSARRAVVIGNGNVALDVGRMLVAQPEELRGTDTADHALDELAKAHIEEVVVLGRRGPVQAAFTHPELLELGELSHADVIVDSAQLELDAHSAAWLASADSAARRNVETLRALAERPPRGHPHRIELRFLRSPVAVLGDGAGRVEAVRVARNRIVVASDGRLHAVPTSEEVIACELILRSVGYQGRALPGLPFDEQRGVVPNVEGRVTTIDGEPLERQYVVGWIKRGPNGVIGTNKRCASQTASLVLEDLAHRRPGASERAEIDEWLGRRVPGLVSWDGWCAIDTFERTAGEPQGRPRVKIVRVEEMLAVAQSS